MQSLKRLSLLAFVLSFCITIQAQVDLSVLSCAVTPDEILGQAHVGFAGAAHVGFAGALGEEIQTNDWDLEGADLIDNFQYAQAGSNTVAIIVIDDFSSDEPIEAADWSTASHGWLVLNVFERMIAALPPESAALLQIETLDMAGDIEFRSDLLATALEARVDELVSQGISRFVVNMSFVFVACEDGNFSHAAWREARESNPNLSLVEATGGDAAYVQQVLSDRRISRMDERGFDMDNRQQGQGNPPARNEQKLAFLRLFENIHMNQDPLRQYFMESHDYTLIPIAAAGNFKWKRPFYPAQWPEVLGVSATNGTGTELWSLSNNGEVSAAGAYFLFDDEIYRAGTSFAAPVVSLVQALDLSNDSPSCSLANNGRPEMSSHGQWNDLPLLNAVEDRC
jgi:hypothetical protein